MNKFILYKATSPSNKLYFGITGETLEDRISKHKYTSLTTNTKFANAIKKYGIDNIKFEIILYNLSKDEACLKEKEYIKKFDTYKNGYNGTLGGEGAFGYKWNKARHSEVHEEKRKKYYENDEWKKKKSKITKDTFKLKPELKEKLTNNLLKYNKEYRYLNEEKRLKALRDKKTQEKMVRSKGCKPFYVFNFRTKEFIGEFLIKSDCAKLLGISNGKISMCLNGRRNFTKDYIFKYTDDPSINHRKFNDNWLLTLKRIR